MPPTTFVCALFSTLFIAIAVGKAGNTVTQLVEHGVMDSVIIVKVGGNGAIVAYVEHKNTFFIIPCYGKAAVCFMLAVIECTGGGRCVFPGIVSGPVNCYVGFAS